MIEFLQILYQVYDKILVFVIFEVKKVFCKLRISYIKIKTVDDIKHSKMYLIRVKIMFGETFSANSCITEHL